MKISYNWLKEIVDFNIDYRETAEILTDIGLEVEKFELYENIRGGLKGLVTGEILKIEKHPNADKLKVATVDIGEQETYTIICGAPNVEEKQKVIVAVPGTTIFPLEGKPTTIKRTKIRGVFSNGMICAEDEIGIGDNHDGIIVIKNSTKNGEKASDYFKVKTDIIYEIGLTPNRADAMSHYGVARDLLAALKYKGKIESNKKLLEISTNNEILTDKSDDIRIIIEDETKCYRYSGLIIKNVKVKESPSWLKTKLKSIGLKPINNIVDTTNYILHEIGQPLHAFDLKCITNRTIKIRCAKKDALFVTLDGNERKLNEDDLMICNDNEEMCIAGVFGGLSSGVNSKTSDIFIESALFDPISVRKTAKRHGLNTDASFRYERGVDPEMVIPALNKAANLIKEIAGGKISSDIINLHPVKSKNKSFLIDFESIRKLCGFSLVNKKMIEILNYLEINVSAVKENIATVTVPAYRNDVTRECDIAEEILRIHGYNSIEIPTKINSSPTFSPVKNSISLQQLTSNHLSSLGFYEILSNSLTKKSYNRILSATDTNTKSFVEIINPLSSDTEVLRQSLAYNALEVIKYNNQHGSSNCKIYEWGKVYNLIDNKFNEEDHLLIALSGLQNEEHWYNGKEKSTFFQLKGILKTFFNLTGVSYSENVFNSYDVWSDGLEYINKSSTLARIGLVSEKLLESMSIDTDCFIAEIYWEEIVKLANKSTVKFKSINKFQKVYRDLSILIEEGVEMKKIIDCVREKKVPILKSISLFDIYRDKKSMSGKKSYAFRFEFLHDKRTLRDKEVDNIMTSIQNQILKEINASLR
mgnify:CR=1 FL=1|tara:strand:- start:564 stop:3005 length:2442 start_codon:yes stop_codon:yes gene_type:complete